MWLFKWLLGYKEDDVTDERAANRGRLSSLLKTDNAIIINGVALPQTVVMEIVETEPVVKGQTASSSYKPAKLSNGVRVMVPPFIDTGTMVVVNTADSSYVERAKTGT